MRKVRFVVDCEYRGLLYRGLPLEHFERHLCEWVYGVRIDGIFHELDWLDWYEVKEV